MSPGATGPTRGNLREFCESRLRRQARQPIHATNEPRSKLCAAPSPHTLAVVEAAMSPLEEATFTAEVVPARVAYLIAGPSRDGLMRSVEEACTRWGGATEPIVAVRADGRISGWDRQLVGLLRVDAMVNVDAPTEAAEKVAASLEKPLIDVRHIDHAGPSMFSTFPGRFALGADTSLSLPSDDTVWQSVALGRLNEAGLESLRQCGLSSWRAPGDDRGGRAQLFGHTPVELSLAQFRQSSASGSWPAAPMLLAVVAPNDVNGCRVFWNFRALRTLLGEPQPMALIPSRGIEHWVDFDKNLAGALARPVDIAPDVVVWGNRMPVRRLDSIAQSLGLVRHSGQLRSSLRFPPPPPREAPFSYATQVDPRHWLAFERRYGSVAQSRALVFPAGATVSFSPPIDGGAGGLALLRVSSPVISRYPQRSSVAGALLDNARWADGALEIGVTLQPQLQFTIRQPSMAEVLAQVLRERGVTSRPSDKAAVVRLVTQRLAIARLVNPIAYGVVAQLTTPRSTTLLRAIEEKTGAGATRDELLDFIGASFGRGGQVVRSYDDLSQRVPSLNQEAIIELARARWIERGFRTRCNDCGLTNFVSLPDVTPAGVCPTCGNECGYVSNGKDALLVYRLDAVVDRASDQGALPQAMAAYVAGMNDPFSYLVPGAELTFPDGTKGDADVLGIAHGRLIVGEVKTFAQQFTRAEIIKDADRAQAAGADSLLIGCPEPLPESMQQLIAREADRRGLSVLLYDELPSRSPAAFGAVEPLSPGVSTA